MVGKAPYYDKNVLRIGSIYPMVASVSPFGKDRMREIFNTTWKGKPFPEAFLEDPDLVKKADPAFYALHKIMALGLSYSMGPRKLVTSAYDAGHIIPFKAAKEFYNEYWTLFGGVFKLSKLLEAKYNRDKYLVNPFGYRLTPDKPYKALNYYIQSSVSGIMHILCAKFFALAPYALFVTIIHDELITLVPTEKLAQAKMDMDRAEESLNQDLKWRVRMRVGWAAGKDMYEAK
jgi:DNA polymerase I-like protein with 3'-5' exonuclease and polymerase domains